MSSSLIGAGWSAWWLIPPVAAGISAAMLFFWMRAGAAGALTTATAMLYLLFAYASFRAERGVPLANWPRWGVPLPVGLLADGDPRHTDRDRMAPGVDAATVGYDRQGHGR